MKWNKTNEAKKKLSERKKCCVNNKQEQEKRTKTSQNKGLATISITANISISISIASLWPGSSLSLSLVRLTICFHHLPLLGLRQPAEKKAQPIINTRLLFFFTRNLRSKSHCLILQTKRCRTTTILLTRSPRTVPDLSYPIAGK